MGVLPSRCRRYLVDRSIAFSEVEDGAQIRLGRRAGAACAGRVERPLRAAVVTGRVARQVASCRPLGNVLRVARRGVAEPRAIQARPNSLLKSMTSGSERVPALCTRS